MERMGEDDPDGAIFLRDLWEEGEREVVLDLVKSGCESGQGDLHHKESWSTGHGISGSHYFLGRLGWTCLEGGTAPP